MEATTADLAGKPFVSRFSLLSESLSLLSRHARLVPIVTLMLGQALSVLITMTGVASSYLAPLRIPLTQSFLVYLSLSAYLVVSLRAGTFLSTLRSHWWIYLLLAIADVQANFLVVKAYQFTSIASIMLLDCFTIPVVMILSALFLGRRYRWAQLAAAVICVCGLALLLWADYLRTERPDHGHSNSTHAAAGPPEDDPAGVTVIFGDVLTLCAAILYGVSNVCEEALVTRRSVSEYLGFLGLFGGAVCGAQLLVLELPALRASLSPSNGDSGWDLLTGFSLFFFVAAMVLYYSATPTMLRLGGAALLNLSLLTSDFWAVIAAVVLFGVHMVPLYFVAFAVIVIGLLLYNLAPSADESAGEEQIELEGPPLGSLPGVLTPALANVAAVEEGESVQLLSRAEETATAGVANERT